MLQTTFSNRGQLTLAGIRTKTGFLALQELMFAVVGGIALAGIGQFLGRTFHLAWPVPLSGSIAAALPRAFIMLVILLRINRFGILTVAGIAEVSTKLVIGFGGWWPMSLVVPLLANTAGDIIWLYLRQLPSRRLSLILTGGSLCGVRVLLALSFWSFLRLPVSEVAENLILILGGIVVINVVLGMVAGLLVGRSVSTARRSE